MTQHIVYLTEINHGYAVFDTKEEAEAFANDEARDYDLVKWNNSEITDTDVVNAEITQLLIEAKLIQMALNNPKPD